MLAQCRGLHDLEKERQIYEQVVFSPLMEEVSQIG